VPERLLAKSGVRIAAACRDWIKTAWSLRKGAAP
jgi:hypothetical protein